MKFNWRAVACFVIVVLSSWTAHAQRSNYRLTSVDIKQPVIWGAECRQPAESGLAFGGQDQQSPDGRPHTRILVDGKWLRIDAELRAANRLQSSHDELWELRSALKNQLAHARRIYFQGRSEEETKTLVHRDVFDPLEKWAAETEAFSSRLAALESLDEYQQAQADYCKTELKQTVESLLATISPFSGKTLHAMHQAQIRLEIAAESLAAEPPPRAMNCGQARLPENKLGPTGEPLVFDSETGFYVLFGGDHLDYLTNDTWVFHLKKQRWFQRRPELAPPPRANHRLSATGDGTVRLIGGFDYASSTGYLSGQYTNHADGPFSYDVKLNRWSGEGLVASNSRTYRSGPFHPDYFLDGPRPNAAEFSAWLSKLPANQWVATQAPKLPRLNRDWGTARIDLSRDLMLRWSGGHSAHGGSDVLHFHFATNRWELPFPVEFPLGQLYANTLYPNGYNFNKRPWITGHTYQNYDYDPPSGLMIKAGRPTHTYVYDPEIADWVGRQEKPKAMQYNSCFYTLTLCATPGGVVCWDRYGRVHRYEHQTGKWKELELTGEPLGGAYVDNSSIVYDSKRDRLLMIATAGYRKPFEGGVWSLDLATNEVKLLEPEGRDEAVRFSNVDKSCYDAENDLMLLGAYLEDAGEHTPTPAYDCKTNRWVTLDLDYVIGEKLGNTTREFPQSRSAGMIYDANRKLIWGVDANSNVVVLKLDLKNAKMQPLKP